MNESISGKNLLRSLKAVSGRAGPQLAIPVGTPLLASLRPVATRKDLQNEEDVRCLTDWRNRFVSAFLNEFEATESQTSRWLAEVVGPDECRILFMVDDPKNGTFGYMGIGFVDWENGSGEADAIVRGRPAPKGVMTIALQTLLAWAQGQLGLRSLHVRVRSDNPALAFYQKCGFVEQKRIPLSCHRTKDRLVWYEDQGKTNATHSLVYHTFAP